MPEGNGSCSPFCQALAGLRVVSLMWQDVTGQRAEQLGRDSVAFSIPATQSDTERALLGKLETCFFDADCAEALLRLARYYNQAQRNDVATGVLQMIIGLSDDAETKGLSLQPQENRVSYFLDGNATGCVNLQSADAEAENYLGQAKEIDGQQAYAFKSLVTSLEGPGDLVGAAWAYLEATEADASDLRAFRLLERLLADHPQLISQCPWLVGGLKVCHKIVEDALDA